MEVREFNKITKEILLDYGFEKVNPRKYVLYLEYVTILVCIRTLENSKYLSYDFSVNALDNITDPPTNVLTDRFDNIFEQKMVHDYRYSPIGSSMILYEEYTEEHLRALLKKMLQLYIDPFKEDAYGHIRKGKFDVRYRVKEFLGMPLPKGTTW